MDGEWELEMKSQQNWVSAAIIAAVMAGGGASAHAQTVEGNVALSSNYVFRGITQTDDGPAISGGFDVSGEGGWYAGTWASNVDFNDGTNLEIDAYGGYQFAASGFDFDLGAIYYAYPDSPQVGGNDQDFLEFYAGAGRSFGAWSADAKISYSDDFYAGTGQAWYFETGAGVDFGNGIGMDARVGFNRFDDFSGADYEDYQIGISGSFAGVGWDARFHDTSDFYGDAVVLSISQSFGG